MCCWRTRLCDIPDYVGNLSPIESILVVAICVVAAAAYFGSQRYLKNKAAGISKVEAYSQKKAAVGALVYPIVGLVLLGVMLFQWNRIPPENIGLAIGFIVFAAVLILYGSFKWFKMRRSR